MKMVYAGSFDPVTLGHLDIIRRGAALCDELTVAVLVNIAKKPAFTVEERMNMLRKVTSDLPIVKVDSFSGLLVEYAKKSGADAILRGVRSVGDLETETTLADINRRLRPECETVLLLARPELACVSSSAVKELAAFGGQLEGMVPAQVLTEVHARLDKTRN